MEVYFSYLKRFAELRTLGGLCLILLSAPGSLHAAGVDFDRDISPILSQKCFACHGPDEEKIKGIASRFHSLPTDYSQRNTEERDAPEILKRLLEDEADIAILVPL